MRIHTILGGRSAAVVLLVLLAASGCWAADIYDYQWVGGDAGAWQADGNWLPGGYPINSCCNGSVPTFSVYIPSNVTVNVQAGPLNTWAAAGTLYLGSGSRVLVPNNSGALTLQVGQSVVNAGEIFVGGLSGGGVLRTLSGTPTGGTTLTGGGLVTLSDGGSISGRTINAANGTLTNADNRIQGAGSISDIVLNNQSVIDANTGGQTLSVIGSTINNTGGTLQASNGGTLQLGGGHWSGGPVYVNGGAIQALDTSTVRLGYTNPGDYDSAGTITGSTLTTAGSGVILASTGTVLNGITNHGNLEVVNTPGIGANNVLLTNAISNTGTITMAGGTIQISGTASLSGGGTVNMGGSSLSQGTLTNVDNRIQGAGSISAITIYNQGVIDASTGSQTLSITGSTINNTGGTLQASNGGTLQLGGGHWSGGPAYVNGGTILAQDGSTVRLGYTNPGDYDSAGTITGSTLNTAGSGVILASTGTVLNGITNHGDLEVVNTPGIGANYATLANTINNTGTITLAGGNLELNLQMFVPGSATLTGGGTVNLGGGYISGSTPNGANGTLTNVGNLIQGAGSFSNIVVDNQSQGVIAANTPGQWLTFSGSILTNQGQLLVAAGSSMSVPSLTNLSGGTLSGGTYDVAGALWISGPISNNAATIILDGPSSSIMSAGVDALASTFSDNQAAGAFEILNGRDFTTAGAFSNEGFLDIETGSTFTVNGIFTNTGTLKVNGDLVADSTSIGAGQKLSGSGTLEGDLLVLGELDPGNSPGTINITGDYTQGPGSDLNIEIAGTGAGEFDQLNVTGSVHLDGDLHVVLYGTGYSPHDGDLFDIINWGAWDGSRFANIYFPNLGAGFSWTDLWGDSGLQLEVRSSGNPGAVPEPGSMFLLAGGLLLFGGHALRRRCGRS